MWRWLTTSGLAVSMTLTLQFNLFTELPFSFDFPYLLFFFVLTMSVMVAIGGSYLPALAIKRKDIAIALKNLWIDLSSCRYRNLHLLTAPGIPCDVRAFISTESNAFDGCYTAFSLSVCWSVRASHPIVSFCRSSSPNWMVIYMNRMGWWDRSGSFWFNNTNWDSGEDICKFYGVSCSTDGYITSISLSNNNLQGYINDSIYELTQLSELDLSDNDINGVTDLLCNMTSLIRLDLRWIQSLIRVKMNRRLQQQQSAHIRSLPSRQSRTAAISQSQFHSTNLSR